MSEVTGAEEPAALALPEHPADPPPAPFPLVAALAPLVAAGVLWAILRSPGVLLFAMLGPVIAVGGVADGRWQRRRRRRRQRRERARALTLLARRVEAEHDRERAALEERVPALGGVVSAPADDPRRWTADPRGAEAVLGRGTVPSLLRVRGVADGAREREVLDSARRLPGAPVTVPLAAGVGIVGDRTTARALARGVLARAAYARPPGRLGLAELPDEGWEWARALPHHGAEPEDGPAVRVVEAYGDTAPGVRAAGGGEAVLALAGRIGMIPADCAAVVELGRDGRARLVRGGPEGVDALGPECLGLPEAAAFARSLARYARDAGVAPEGRALPATVRPEDLASPARADDGGLWAPVGLSARGVHGLDLVADGPHAVVAGTTGSGKSEFLVTWAAGMASARAPGELSLLLVDFKGGAAFRALRELPHCVGLVTDLGDDGVDRALRSLDAEVRRRERVLREHGVADVRELEDRRDPGRLVIVVDEFAAMLTAFPDLHALFVDLAARGRALGIHLVLSTQRPTGVLRDSLLANCGLRVSLRVHDAQDSRAVLGTPGAARIPATTPGRLLVSTGGEATMLQAAVTGDADVRRIAARWAEAPAPHRPWLDPLPAEVPLAPLAARREPEDPDGLVLGLEDRPEEQCRRVASYAPERDGNLLVIGGHGTGKSTLVASLTGQDSGGRVEALPPQTEAAWDRLAALAEGLGGPGTDAPPGLLLVDDLDTLAAGLGDEHSLLLLEAVQGLLRDGPRAGLRLLVTAQRLAGILRPLEGLFDERLDLAGVGRGTAGPGAGRLRGHRIRLALPEAADGAEGRAEEAWERRAAPLLALREGERYLLVSRRPRLRLAELARRTPAVCGVDLAASGAATAPDAPGLTVSDGAAPTVVVSDPDGWQSAWGLLERWRRDSTLVFDGCTAGELRALGVRSSTPPLLPGRERVLVLAPEGALRRARWGPG